MYHQGDKELRWSTAQNSFAAPKPGPSWRNFSQFRNSPIGQRSKPKSSPSIWSTSIVPIRSDQAAKIRKRSMQTDRAAPTAIDRFPFSTYARYSHTRKEHSSLEQRGR